MSKRTIRLKISVSAILFCALVPVFAQSGRVRDRKKTGDSPADDAVRLRVEEVLLPVSVRTFAGKLPGKLERTDLVVVEDGKKQIVNSVLRSPANLLFILDAGGESVSKNVNLNRDIALKLIDRLGSEDQAAIIIYGDRVNLIADWTRDKKALRDALNWKFRPTLASQFYASLNFAADEVLSRVSGRRSVVIATDGVDSRDSHQFEQALVALHHARATVYVASQGSIIMGLIKPEAFNTFVLYEMLDPKRRARVLELRRYYRELEAAETTLKGFAEETGGAAWCPTDFDAFKDLDQQIAAEMNTEYVVAYQSQRPPDDAKFHSVRVTATRGDLQVRSRRGLYSSHAQKPEAAAAPPSSSAHQ